MSQRELEDQQSSVVAEFEPITDASEDEDEEISHSKYEINSYGADYTADILVQRLRRGDIYIPDFQRAYVWGFKQAARFIESLLLGLPVPGVFFSKDEDQKLLVLDGQQRLRTLQSFYDGKFHNQKFALKEVQTNFVGKTYETLDPEDRRRLDDSIIHATIVQQMDPADDDSSIYHIFQRLNTGGSPLQPQEIRASIYHGAFNDLLNRLNEDETWRNVFGPKNKRAKDQELILRFLALYYNSHSYEQPMNEFLNKFMQAYRNLDFEQAGRFDTVFKKTIQTVFRCLGKIAFKPTRALNAAVFDGVMVGVAKRLESGEITDCDVFKQRYEDLLKDEQFRTAYTASTSDPSSLAIRLRLATQAFTQVS